MRTNPLMSDKSHTKAMELVVVNLQFIHILTLIHAFLGGPASTPLFSPQLGCTPDRGRGDSGGQQSGE